jgi:hypothetical protein
MADDKETVEVTEEEEEEEVYDDDLQEPPSLKPGELMKVIRKKGVLGAMRDEGMGPHMHLFTIIGIVIIIAIGVGVWSAIPA